MGKVLDETKDLVINIVVNGEELDEAIKNMKLLNIGGFVNKFKKTDGNIN